MAYVSFACEVWKCNMCCFNFYPGSLTLLYADQILNTTYDVIFGRVVIVGPLGMHLKCKISHRLIFCFDIDHTPANCPYLIENIPLLTPKKGEKEQFLKCVPILWEQKNYVVICRKLRNIPTFKDFTLICPYFLGFKLSRLAGMCFLSSYSVW